MQSHRNVMQVSVFHKQNCFGMELSKALTFLWLRVCFFIYICIVAIKIKMLCEAFKRLPTSSWKSTNFGQFNPGVWVNVSPFMIYLKTLLILSTLFLENWCWDFHVKFKCENMYHVYIVHTNFQAKSDKVQYRVQTRIKFLLEHFVS